MRNFLLLLLLLAGAQMSAQTYFLQGDATFLGDDCYRLTPALNTQNGAVWYADQIDLTQAFDLEFLMNFGDNDENGADGICFVLQTVGNTALGESGGGLGFLGFAPAFGVEFDTWQNTQFGDPWFDHIGIVSNGDVSHISGNSIAGPVQASATSTNIEDGEDHIVRITWDPETTLVQVFFDCEFRLESQVDLVNQIFNGQTNVFWGFTAATGGAVNNQTVCLQENILSSEPEILLCTGGSTQLVAAGNPNGGYNWTPTTYLDEPTSQTPTATPEENITYTVEYTDLCGNALAAEVSIILEDLEVNISGPTEINCASAVATLTANSNFGQPNAFSWSTENGSFTTGTGAPSVIINSGGTYSVNLIHDEQCSATDEITVVADFTQPLVLIEGDSLLNCIAPSILLEGSTDATTAQYVWSTNGGLLSGDPANPAITAQQGGTYTLTVTDTSNGCSAEESVEISEDVIFPFLTMGTADTLSCRVASVTIEGTVVQPENALISWSSDSGGLPAGSANPAPIVSEEGWYILTATHPTSGCVTTDSVYVFSDGQGEVDLSQLTFPNVFSPNNDGVNDRYFPFLLNDISFNVLGITSKLDFKVYNRWGTLVYDTEGRVNTWDGSDGGGNILNEGAYYYIVDIETRCGTPPNMPVTGSFEILR